MPVFEIGDDVGILAQVKGLHGFETTYNTTYMSLPIGWLLVTLYNINSSFPWYSTLLYMLLGVSLFVSINLFYLYIRATSHRILFIVTSVFLHWKIGSFVSFTAVALIVFVSAVGIIFYCLTEVSSPRYLIIISSILFCVSYAIRPSIVPVGALLALPLLLFHLKRLFCKVSLVVMVCLPLLAVICVDAGMFSYLNSSGQIEDDYAEYNRLRSELLDTGLGDNNNKTREAIAAAGWTPAEFRIIKNWWLHDRDLLDKNKINVFLKSNVDNKLRSLFSLSDGFDQVKEYGRILSIIFLVFAFVSTSRTKRLLRFPLRKIVLFLVCLLAVFILMCFRFPMRVAFPVFYSLLLFMPVYASDQDNSFSGNIYARLCPFILLMVVFALMAVDGFSALSSESVVKRVATQHEFNIEAGSVAQANGPDTVFVNLNPLITNLVSSYRPFDEDNPEFKLKMLPGGAFSHTKWYEDYINRQFNGCGKNVVPCLINNKNVIFYFYDTWYLPYDTFVKKMFIEYLNGRYKHSNNDRYIYINTVADNRFSVDDKKAGFVFFQAAIR